MLKSKSVLFLLGAALAVNLYLLIPNAKQSGFIFRRAWRLPLEAKYAFLYPALYRDLENIKHQVPETATLWLVAPVEAWHINYYLYPRTLRWGSPQRSDLEALRRAHPDDWVISHLRLDPQTDRAWVYPPLSRSSAS